jgi:hypothetical protein
MLEIRGVGRASHICGRSVHNQRLSVYRYLLCRGFYLFDNYNALRNAGSFTEVITFYRIERFWRDVFYGCLSQYKRVFNELENNGLLNVEDPRHLLVLHYVFVPRLRHHLNLFREGWNDHPLSSENNFTPNQLMLMHRAPHDNFVSVTVSN